MLAWSSGAFASGGAASSPPGATPGVAAGGYFEFDARMLHGADGGAHAVDLSRFTHGNPVLPGELHVDVVLNDDRRMKDTVQFVAREPGANAQPCFAEAQLSRFGIEPVAPAAAVFDAGDGDCRFLHDAVPGASAHYDFGEQALRLVVPQAHLRSTADDAIDPELWDPGIDAARLNYHWNVFHSSAAGFGATSGVLQLNAGVNLGRWRFRQSSALSVDGGESRYQAQSLHAQRELAPLRATLSIGETHTTGLVLDAFALRGVQLASDERMLPASQRAYAPVVRGVARTNAQVTIHQGDILLHQESVAPGAFEIRNLQPIGFGDDLRVTVAEADGERTTTALPYSAAPQLLRPGVGRYWLALGQAMPLADSVYTPAVLYAAGQRGLGNALTASAGVLTTQDYTAANAGGIFATRFGGVSVDATMSRDRRSDPDRARTGASVRVGYNRHLASTGTSIHLAGYRHSTGQYRSFADALLFEDARRRAPGSAAAATLPWSESDRQRDRFELHLDQRLAPGWGRLYASGSTRTYWNRASSDTQYQLGHGGHYRGVGFDLSVNRAFDSRQGKFDQLLFTVSVPLFGASSDNAGFLSGRVWSRPGGDGQAQLDFSRVAGAQRQASYSVYAARAMTEGSIDAKSYGATGAYQGALGHVHGGASKGNGYWQANLGGSGSLLVHGHGVVPGPSLGETVALVKAEGASGLRIDNAVGAGVNRSGYGVVPYLSPYARNRVLLGTEGVSPDVTLDSTDHEVIPTAGAIVRIEVGATRARTAVLRVQDGDGAPLPFGAEVHGNGRSLGFVGQGGAMFLRDIEDVTRIRVLLGQGRSCEADVDLSAAADTRDTTAIVCTHVPEDTP